MSAEYAGMAFDATVPTVTHLMGDALLPACGAEHPGSSFATAVLGDVTCADCRILPVVPYQKPHPLTEAGDLVCAECGRRDEFGYVVTILDVTDAKHTRTEVCLACHTEQENDQ